jgi:hypothetical protein
MLTRHERGLLIAGGCLYLTVLGFLTGMIVERVRFDRQRATVLQHLAANAGAAAHPPHGSGAADAGSPTQR